VCVAVVGETALQDPADVGLEVDVTWAVHGWRRPKEGLGHVVDRVQARASATGGLYAELYQIQFASS
jgi:hypothetical protein